MAEIPRKVAEVEFSDEEKDFMASLFQTCFRKGLSTFHLRAYFHSRTVKDQIVTEPHYKFEYMELKNNKWVLFSVDASTLEKLKSKMSDFFTEAPKKKVKSNKRSLF